MLKSCSGASGVWIEVDAGELDGDIARGGPTSDGAEGVAAAGADVEDAEGLGRGPAFADAVEEGECGFVAAGDAVDVSEIAEKGAVLLIAAG